MTTLQLQPTGLANITFNQSISQAATGYYSPKETYEFGEQERIEILYSETEFGGRAVGKDFNLVPVIFDVFVHGTTRDQMLARAHALNKAVTSLRGGKLEYKPDGASISTFYLYEGSQPPEIIPVDPNFWDAKIEGGGRYVIGLRVNLMTHPVATSGSFEDITPDRTTLRNSYQASYSYFNYFDLTGIKGDLPAIIQAKFTNLQSGATKEINRIYLASRSTVFSSTLNDVKQIYEAEDKTSETGTWATQADANRSNGQYERCTPAALNSYNSLRVQLDNESAHRGRVAVFACVKPSSTASNWDLRLSYKIGSTIIWTSVNTFSPEFNSKWHLAYCGDITLPPMSVGNDTINNPELSLDVRLTGGSVGQTLDIDFVTLVFSDETALQFNISDDRSYGMTNAQRLFTEVNDDDVRVAHITDLSDNVDFVAKSVYGSLGIEALEDTRYYVLFERVSDGDLHVPTDQIEVSTKALFRTIYPFGA